MRCIIQIVRRPDYSAAQSMVFRGVVLRLVFGKCWERESVTKDEYMAKVNEVDQLLNDPTTSLDPMRVWTLLSELAGATAFDLRDEYASPRSSVGPAEVS